jgi:catechol 2,3-dioxygenase-like lactoylglutathione lyase family enzyme
MKIGRVTIAVTNMPAMLRFYNGVFEADLTLIGGTEFYAGTLAEGISLLFCPNDIAKVEAKQNRQQFRFIVDDLAKIRESVTAYGGQILNSNATDDANSIGVRDPDGNTIEFAVLS